MQLTLRDSGPADAPAILFLHASPLSGRMWLPQFERLTEFYCMAPDLPGHGGSAAIPLSMPDTVQRLADLIHQKAAGGRAHVVGLSFGGVVAQALMVAAPDSVDHVILSGTSTRLGKTLVALNGLNGPILRLLSPKQSAGLVGWQFRVPNSYRASLADDLQEFSPQAFGAVNMAYSDIETPSATQSPTLVAVAEKETVIARRAARQLAQIIPGAVTVVVAGMGHLWSLQAPDLFSDTVAAWIGDQPLPKALNHLSSY